MMEMNPPANTPAPNELGPSLGKAPEKGRRFDRKARLRWSNRMFRILCISSAAFVCLVLFCILVLMLRTGVLTFADVSLEGSFLYELGPGK